MTSSTAAQSGRLSCSRCQHCSIISVSACGHESGMVGRLPRRATLMMMAMSMVRFLYSWYGRMYSPVMQRRASSQMMMPIENTSLLSVNFSPKYASGGQYVMVPRILASVSRFEPVLKRARPKSHTLIVQLRLTSMFIVLRSRCTIDGSLVCSASTPLHSCRAHSSVCDQPMLSDVSLSTLYSEPRSQLCDTVCSSSTKRALPLTPSSV
mmetsp:Transcript_35415/g.86606  ORF Transcript_35415/g.86606 Transcript_35415/m.86606 type:complete len:209 (-) Transcript_35415:108-734(-)